MYSKESKEYTKIFNIQGFQNTELQIQNMIKAEEYSRIKKVVQKGDNVLITFERCPEGKMNPSFVLQISKKKHDNWKKIVCKQTCLGSSFVDVVEIEDKWIVFFNKWTSISSEIRL